MQALPFELKTRILSYYASSTKEISTVELLCSKAVNKHLFCKTATVRNPLAVTKYANTSITTLPVLQKQVQEQYGSHYEKLEFQQERKLQAQQDNKNHAAAYNVNLWYQYSVTNNLPFYTSDKTLIAEILYGFISLDQRDCTAVVGFQQPEDEASDDAYYENTDLDVRTDGFELII